MPITGYALQVLHRASCRTKTSIMLYYESPKLKLNSPVSVAINRCNVGNHTNVCGSRLIQLTNISSRIIPSCV